MGVGARKGRAKAFKQEVDKAVADEVKAETLLPSEAIVEEWTVECFREPEDADISLGAHVRLIDLRDQIDVFVGTKPVGYVVPGAAAELRAVFTLDKTAHRSLRGRIVDVSTLSPTFVVAVHK